MNCQIARQIFGVAVCDRLVTIHQSVHFAMSLNKFRHLLCSVLIAWVTIEKVHGAVSPTTRPNILFCLADDWAFPHAGIYGDHVVKTPIFDRVAREGVLFTHAFSAAPSCTPSRAAILTGQAPHRLAEGGNLWGFLPPRFAVFPDMLERAGYIVGFTRKGWGPGDFKAGGREHNPAGPQFKSFADFLKTVPADKPFYFWFGSQDPHRPYAKDSGAKSGMHAENVNVPAIWPDDSAVRNDILDYYFAVERFDREVGELLQLLGREGRLENTLVVITGDNGWPFPRAKANLYDAGTRQPFAIRWPEKIKPGRTLDDFIVLTDLAPTFLEAAGLPPRADMTGKSILGLATGKERAGKRTTVFLERERHANVRRGDLGYPSRAIRTGEFLYIRNYHPDRWPAGDPEMWKAVGPYGDCDDGPTKQLLLTKKDDPAIAKYFQLAFEKRPAEELYNLIQDPDQLVNVAGQKQFSRQQKKLSSQLDDYLRKTKDPRAFGNNDSWDSYPYFGPPVRN